ncbi:MAG: glycosyltransferase [Gammaproteobacteria bacterium]
MAGAQFNNHNLSVIIPFRADPGLPHLSARLVQQCAALPQNEQIEFIVVDSGSPLETRLHSEQLCVQHGIRYLYHETEGAPFSIGTARDFGVCRARGLAVTFLDVDLRVADDYWGRLLTFMSRFGISKSKKRFFVVPCMYLTEAGTEEFLAAEPAHRFMDFYLHWLNGNGQLVQTMAPCSSVMVVDRLHYLSVGGHRPEFRGHGYEDFELYHRLISEEGVLPRARDYYTDSKSWKSTNYRGFRSEFSLLGRHALMANLFVVHLWHQRPKTSVFYGNMDVNRAIWKRFFKEFDETREHPEPLVDADAMYRKILFFGKPFTDAARRLRDIFPLLGERLFVSEQDFIDEDDQLDERAFESLLGKHGVEAVLFPNPYANAARLKIYNWCRRTKFPYLCFERGALADSWFLDPNGFSADSSSYALDNWKLELSDVQRNEVETYIKRLLWGVNALESEGGRIGRDALASRLRIGGKKVLFVPLQRPSDTEIRYFAGEMESYESFLRFIDEAAEKLRTCGWVVLCKKDPLEAESIPLEYACYVPDDTHFIDLLELADGVALINSRVGIYAMMMGKPCFVFGEAFYHFDGINKRSSVYDLDGFCEEVDKQSDVNMDDVYMFIYFLKNRFYSYGKADTTKRRDADGSDGSITVAIDFYEIRIPRRAVLTYTGKDRPAIPLSAPLFERFHLDIESNKTLPSSSSAPEGKQKSHPNKTAKGAVPSGPPEAEQKSLPKKTAKGSVPSGPPQAEQKPLSEKTPKEHRAAVQRKSKWYPRTYLRDLLHTALRPLRLLLRKR